MSMKRTKHSSWVLSMVIFFFIADNFGEMEWKECPHNQNNDYDESFVCKWLKKLMMFLSKSKLILYTTYEGLCRHCLMGLGPNKKNPP